jgi:WD40 repeat protein
VWDVAAGRQVAVLDGGVAEVTCVAWRPGDGRVLASGAGSVVRLWDARSWGLLQEVQGGCSWCAGVRCLAWHPAGEALAFGMRYGLLFPTA